MTRRRATIVAGLLLAGCSSDTDHAHGAPPDAGDPTAALALVRTLPLPGVEGRIDHLAFDARGQRLFVAALGNDTLEVVDLVTGRTTTIRGLAEPQGVALIPDPPRLLVTSGEAAAADLYDASTLQHLLRVPLADDPDNLRGDAAAQCVWVGHGAGATGAIGRIDLAAGDPASAVRGPDIALAGHPESFQLEARGSRVFVNVPSARHVAVIDRAQGRVVATWPPGGAADNFPMALDEDGARLFVGCRSPARLVVLDTRDGRPVAELDCVGDADDVFWDAAARRVYVSGGEGAVAVFAPRDTDRWERLADVPTAPGARTCLFDAASRLLWLAVPHRGAQAAEIREYRVR